MISRHQRVEINKILIKLIELKMFILKFIIIIFEIIKLKELIDIIIGQGLKFNRKYG